MLGACWIIYNEECRYVFWFCHLILIRRWCAMQATQFHVADNNNYTYAHCQLWMSINKKREQGTLQHGRCHRDAAISFRKCYRWVSERMSKCQSIQESELEVKQDAFWTLWCMAYRPLTGTKLRIGVLICLYAQHFFQLLNSVDVLETFWAFHHTMCIWN